MNNLIFIFCFLGVTLLSAQNFKKEIDPKSKKTILVGKITTEEFKDSSFSWWFNDQYNFYRIDKESLEEISKSINDDLTIKIFMGTWCSDSRREVPRFIKILDSLKFDKDKYEIIAIDRDKKGLADEAEGWNIELVPTIIFMEGEKEIGRIIEAPEESLELDFETIIKKKSRN